MNIHKKLKTLGFKKTTFHKPGNHPIDHYPTMVLDIKEIKYDSNRNKKEVIKEHPKSNSFWVMNYENNYIFWALLVNHSLSTIWMEDCNSTKRDRLKTIYSSYSRDNKLIVSKRGILDILPGEVKRNFILKELLF